MAITISNDHYHTSKNVIAEPFDAAEAERLADFRKWTKLAKREAELGWRSSPKPLDEKETLSFAFDEGLAPRKFRLTRGDHHWDYTDYIGLGGANAVSQRFKDVIESIEPGVHQFLPLELHSKDGSLIDEPFYFWRIRTSLDAISPELGGVKQLGATENHLWEVEPGDGREKLAVHKRLIEGRAAWYDVRFKLPPFVSDQVVSRLKEKELGGWTSMHHWKEV